MHCVHAAAGDVVMKQTWDKCIKPDGAFDGKPIKEKDAIELVTGKCLLSEPIWPLSGRMRC